MANMLPKAAVRIQMLMSTVWTASRKWTGVPPLLAIVFTLLLMHSSSHVSANHDGLVISNLTVGSGKGYEIVDDGLAAGALVYIDRQYTFTSVPSGLRGLDYILTANEDKQSSGGSFVSFNVNKGVTVYVAYDVRATSLPTWLAGWTDTGLAVDTSDVDLRLYARDFPAGQVALGGNMATGASGAGSNYSVIVKVNATAPAPVVTIGSAQVNPDDVVQVPVTIDAAPDGVSGFILDITVSDPSVARIDQVVLGNAFVALNPAHDDISEARALFSGVDTGSSVEAGATNVTLATLHIQGLVEGSSQVGINIIAMDDDHGFGAGAESAAGSITVTNATPVVSISSSSSSVNQGSAFSGSASISDPGDQGWDVTIDYGDGSAPQHLTLNSPSATLNHAYASSGVFTVTVTVTDDDGALDSDTFSVTVGSTCPALPGLASPTQDLDGDGRCEDLNGNNRLDFDDIAELFQRMNTSPIQDHPLAFDFNGNGLKDMDDVVALFGLVVSAAIQS